MTARLPLDGAFERAFVATTYLLGRRGDLTRGLEAPGEAAERLEARLGAPERTERARHLSEELAKVAATLASWSVA